MRAADGCDVPKPISLDLATRMNTECKSATTITSYNLFTCTFSSTFLGVSVFFQYPFFSFTRGFGVFLLAAIQRSSSPNLVRLSNMVRSTQDNVPVPRARRVLPEHEGKYKVSMPKGLTARSRRLLAKQQTASESHSDTRNKFPFSLSVPLHGHKTVVICLLYTFCIFSHNRP